ncbi:transporter substrate-binding domain-containing protein [Pseudalkalibacillus caeni]|uniref:Transporter substrate-binding domain-containing protein n=1 Tax=Exobacillus caeni TaxID=2574798 RepID=A0A5R9F5S7_9BACL|nr:transporter substrate-binding domain-containing protein [Pseudalkalibacillus caeni]TLS38401.1 transporter substrate-binding domain-containing protein [Pseudalkalibacillus caeni]
MKKTLLVLLTVLVSVMLGACSSKESGSEAKSTLEKIKAEDEIVVAMGGRYPPFNYMNKENELDGFDVDITKELAKRLGVEEKIVSTEWDSIIAGLNGGKFDIILGSMAITDERQKKVDFVHYYTSGAAVILPEGSDIKSADELKGRTVGVGLGTTYEEKARELGADVKTYSSSTDAFTDMMNGRVDAVISDKLLSTFAIQEKGYPFHTLDKLLYEEKMGIAVRKDDKELKEEIQKIMDNMMEDGTYAKISEKTFGEDIR